MKPYDAKYSVGTAVRIADLSQLERFRAEWRFHHPLEQGQLVFAGRTAKIATVAFYHGGDVLYTLDEVPGIWHEECVHEPEDKTRSLLVSRVSIIAYICMVSLTILFRDSRCILAAIVIAFVPIIAGPRLYRFVGIIAAVGAFLVTAVMMCT